MCRCRRKERLCNDCVRERQQETTSECEDTDSDTELGSSSPPTDNNSPPLDGTPRDTIDNDRDSSTVCADDSILSSCDSLLDENQLTAGSSWSMRGTAYSALSWVSGVMSRSFVRSHVTDNQPAVNDDDVAANVIANAAQSEETTVVVKTEQTVPVNDSHTENVNSPVADNVSADSPPGVSEQELPVIYHPVILGTVCSTAIQSEVLPGHDSIVGNSSHDLTLSDISQSLQTDDSLHRYPYIYCMI